MRYLKNNFFKFSALLAIILSTGASDAVGSQSARSATSSNVAPARAEGRDVKRATPTSGAEDSNIVSRSAVRRPNVTTSRAAANTSAAARAGARSVSSDAAVGRPSSAAARSAVIANPIARSAVRAAVPVSGGRGSATSVSRAAVSRAASSRATAVFNDVSKIGGGYAQCR